MSGRTTRRPNACRTNAVLEDQRQKGQVIKMSELEACGRYHHLVVASLGAMRKGMLGGVVTARVLFDGTRCIEVNTRTRIRDQERAPVAADLKRTMREKAAHGEHTFALTAQVSEAHGQVPIDPRDWHQLGCQVNAGGDTQVNTVGTFGVPSASYCRSRVAAALGRLLAKYLVVRSSKRVALIGDPRLPPQSRRGGMSFGADCLLRALSHGRGATLMIEDSGRRRGRLGWIRGRKPQSQTRNHAVAC